MDIQNSIKQPSCGSSIYDASLGNSEIRILALLPDDNPAADVVCELSTEKIENGNKRVMNFQALSYTWGSAELTESICINKQAFLVTQNLKSFLQHARKTDVAISYWIDAICINQNDEEEKSRQIPFMNVIYAKASELVIWLGPASEDSSVALRSLSLLGEKSPFQKMPILVGGELSAVGKLLSRPWWTRIWILQEVAFGAMSYKLGEAKVKCGRDEITWPCLVIAAVRMQAHKQDMRQYFPNVDKIIMLEELRAQAARLRFSPADKTYILEMVVKYRSFSSANPKDKIYATIGFASDRTGKSTLEFSADYSATPEQVFTSFALHVSENATNLNFLRFCQSRSLKGLPSWIPDWSAGTTLTQLPRQAMKPRSPLAPWWCQPSRKAVETQEGSQASYEYLVHEEPLSPTNAMHENEMDRLRLGADVAPLRVATSFDELPEATKQFCLETAGLKEHLDSFFASGECVFLVNKDDDLDHVTLGDDVYQQRTERLIRRGELITERRTKEELLHQEDSLMPKYSAALGTVAKTQVDLGTECLCAEGIIWDTIEAVNDAFVEDIEAKWENPTHFMVSVGRCKEMAFRQYPEPNPYTTPQLRHEAFWLTLLAGRTTEGGVGDVVDIKSRMDFEKWLPEIPSHWDPDTPPLTTTSAGRLQVAECAQIITPVIRKHLLKSRTITKSSDLELQLPGVAMKSNLQPDEWTAEDARYFASRFEELAALWKTQPYDLYNRPFELPSVVPDPYWRARCRENSLSPSEGRLPSLRMLAFMEDSGARNLQSDRDVKQAFASNMTMIPTAALGAGFEKYALGRKFCVTKKGYFGLVPKDANAHDRVCILFGSEVPFILRKHRNGIGYEMIGEAYVHGVMEGEVIQHWEMGTIEAGRIRLR